MSTKGASLLYDYFSFGHVLAFTHGKRECKQMHVAIGNELYLEPIFNGFIWVKRTLVKGKQFVLKPAKQPCHKVLFFIKLTNILH